MRDTDRDILLFIRDEYNERFGIEPRAFEIHNKWDGEKVSRDQLENLAYKGYLKEVSGSYELTPEGLQAVTLEEVDRTLTNTNQRLSESNQSQQRSSAIQAVFSVAIITLTVYQVVLALNSRGHVILSMTLVLVGSIVSGVTIALGLPALIKSLNHYSLIS